jgi:hypothetical protein
MIIEYRRQRNRLRRSLGKVMKKDAHCGPERGYRKERKQQTLRELQAGRIAGVPITVG